MVELEYPEFRLYPDLSDAAKKLYGQFGSAEVDYETAAKIIGHASADSSQFRSKMAAMKQFRLVEGRGKVKVTEIGRKLTFPNTSEEQNEGALDALTAIPLWKELYEKFTKQGKEPPIDNFWADLRLITNVTPDQAQKEADSVRKAYMEDIRYLKPLSLASENRQSPSLGKITPMQDQLLPDGAVGMLTLKDAGHVYLKDADTFKIAQAYMEVISRRLGIQEKPTKPA